MYIIPVIRDQRVIHKCKKISKVFSPKKSYGRFNHDNAKIKIKSSFQFKLNTVYMKYLKMFSTKSLDKLLNIFKYSEYKTELQYNKGNFTNQKYL